MALIDLETAMRERHSVRQYDPAPLSNAVKGALIDQIEECNRLSGLHIQLVTDEPAAFEGGLVKYGSFENVRNYIALVGRRGDDLDERCGYYGQKIVLRAQQIGLNTCWVGLKVRTVPGAYKLGSDEKLCLVIAVGYGLNEGKPHASKTPEQVSNLKEGDPEWFRAGVEAALLAPTAMNQQKFRLERRGRRVTAKAGLGFFTKVDLGIVKYNFELGAGAGNFLWK
ncbi:MAG: nitroreductase [Eubacterium sp.]|nr:nitroreductase [Eubacterium sp.]